MQIFIMARMERFMLVVIGTGCNFSNDFTRETDPYVDFQHCVLCALQKEIEIQDENGVQLRVLAIMNEEKNGKRSCYSDSEGCRRRSYDRD